MTPNSFAGNGDRTYGNMHSEMRVLVALDDEYRLYREATARAIRDLRPHITVDIAQPETLSAAIQRMDPILVICSKPNTVSPNGRPAWLEFRPEPDQVSLLCLDGEYLYMPNPALDELISAVDDAEELARTKDELGGC